MEESRTRFFLTTAAILTSRSVLNLIWHTTPRSDVNWLSGIPPAPKIHYAKKHLEESHEGYSCLVADLPTSPVVRRPSDLDQNLLRDRRHIVTFDAVLPSLKVRKVGMILSLVFLMNRTSMAGITLVVLVST